jgi:hypothetical protein
MQPEARRGDPLLGFLGIDREALSPLQRTLFAGAVLLTLLTAGQTLFDVRSYCGIDFRNRVVGARVLLRGENPYTFRWQPGMPEELLDPIFDQRTPLHRLTVPPTTLCLYALVAGQPYPALRLLSWAAEWAAMLASIALLARMVPGQRLRFCFLLVAGYLFLPAYFWRLHVERGQVYAFHLLLLTVGAYFARKDRLDSARAGIAFGLALALRPNFLLLVPAFAVLGRWRTAAAALATFTGAVLLTLPLAPPNVWRSYLDMGNLYYLSTWNPEALPSFPPPPVPDKPLEGYAFPNGLNLVDSTSLPILYQLFHEPLGWPVVDVGLVCKVMLVALGLILLGLLYRSRRRHSPRLTLAMIAVFLVDSEYLLPHRWEYVDVMFLLPLGLLLPYLAAALRRNSLLPLLLLLGLVIGQSSQGIEPLCHLRDDLARSVLVMGSLTALVVLAWVGRLSARSTTSPEPSKT